MDGRTSIAVLLLFATPLCALAQDAEESFESSTKYERYSVHYDVNADGTHVETHESTLRVLRPQGVSNANRASVRFSERLQEAEILSAYTLKSDGRRIDVPASNYQNASNTGQGDAAPMFSDISTRWVVFPEVTVGDAVTFSYRVKQKEPVFPGHFSALHAFSKFQIYDTVEVTLTAPRSLELRIQARDVHGGELEGNDDRRHWKWTLQNPKAALPEVGAVSPVDYGPLIAISTFRDYGELAAAYDVRARPKATVSERVRQLAAELTAQSSGPAAQAEAFYDWVTKNIKFAGHCVGNGGVVPHDADWILTNRLGDCKDHVVLLQALLASQGIDSWPVLINSGPTYTLPDVPAVEAFNHVITYIPELELYADPTTEDVAFGALPQLDYGKPVVHTVDFKGIHRTPSADYTTNRARIRTELVVHDDGSADGESHIEVQGALAAGYRSWMEQVQPRMEDLVMRSILSSSGYTGTGSILRDDSARGADHFRYGGRYHIDELINVDGPGALNIKSPFAGGVSISSFTMSANEAPRTVSYACYGGIVSEEFTIVLPSNVQLLALPRDAEIRRVNGVYTATYRATGSTVNVVRVLEDRIDGGVCTPADQATEKPFAAAVLKDLRAQVVYMDMRGDTARVETSKRTGEHVGAPLR